jgi:hypothetical protein
MSLTRLRSNTKLLKLSCRGSSLVERRPEKAGVASSILAPGTTQSCKRLFPEEVCLSVGFVADPPIFRNSLQCEFSDLLGQERSGLVNRLGIGHHIPETVEARNGEGAQLVELFLNRTLPRFHGLVSNFPKSDFALADDGQDAL